MPLVFHEVLPVDDAMAVGTGFKGVTPLQGVEELGWNIHVAPQAGAVANRGHRHAPTHANRAVTLEVVGANPAAIFSARLQGVDFALYLGHLDAGDFTVLLDRGTEALQLVGPIGEKLLLGLDGFDQFGDFGFARLYAFAGLFNFALGGDVFLRVLGQRKFVLGAADRGLFGLQLALLFVVVT